MIKENQYLIFFEIMRKKIILAIATIVIAIIAMVNVKINSQNGTLSDISMVPFFNYEMK